MNNTAISANKEKLIFKNESHRKFYEEWLPKCRYQDVYHKALAYCLGINEDKVYNIKSYLLASLFNAVSTMNSYYKAEVNHDMPQFAG